MAWFKVDDRFYTSDKVLSIPRRQRLAAVGLWLLLGNWCADQLTDGEIPAYMVEEIGGTEESVEALLKAGLWVRNGEDYRFHKWEKYQPMRDTVEAEREAKREKMAEWRAKKRQKAVVNSSNESVTSYSTVTDESVTGYKTVRNDVVASPPTRPDPTRPVQETKVSSVEKTERKKAARKLPDKWEPTNAHRERAAAARLNVDHEAEKFKAHALTHDRRAVEWNQAFTQWLLKATERTSTTAAAGKSLDRQGDLLRAEAERLESLTRQAPPVDEWHTPQLQF